jgi:uncharacterized protein YjiS (DUF1127 family)
MSSAIKSVTRSEQHGLSRPRTQGLREVFRRVALAYRIYRERRALMSLSAEALKDLGLSKADAYREGSRSIWDLPANRMY